MPGALKGGALVQTAPEMLGSTQIVAVVDPLGVKVP
jgi:hypothetical protein